MAENEQKPESGGISSWGDRLFGNLLGAVQSWGVGEFFSRAFGMEQSPLSKWFSGNPLPIIGTIFGATTAIDIAQNMQQTAMGRSVGLDQTPAPQLPQPVQQPPAQRSEPPQQHLSEQSISPPPQTMPNARPRYEPPSVTAQAQGTSRNKGGFDSVEKHAGLAFDELDSLTNNGRRYPDMPDSEKPGRPDTKGIQKRAENAWDELDKEVQNAPLNRPQERRAVEPPSTQRKATPREMQVPPSDLVDIDGIIHKQGADGQFRPIPKPESKVPAAPPGGFNGREAPVMGKIQGFYQILGVGGVTQDSSGKTVPATEGNIEQHFKKPLPPAPPKNTIDLDGDGIPDVPLRQTYNMPMEHKNSSSMLHDDGMIMQAPDPAKSNQFKKCVEYAEKHGLTAVLALPRQDVDLNGRETPGHSTLVQHHPSTIYLDKSGNEVRPEGAPKYSEFPGIDQNEFKEKPKTASQNRDGIGQRPPQTETKPLMKEASPGIDPLATRRQVIKDAMEKQGLFSKDPGERKLQEQRIDTGGLSYIRQRESVLGIDPTKNIRERSDNVFDTMDKKIAEEGQNPKYDSGLLTPAKSMTGTFNSSVESGIKCEVDCKAAFTAAAKGIEPPTPFGLDSSMENTGLKTAITAVTTGVPKLG